MLSYVRMHSAWSAYTNAESVMYLNYFIVWEIGIETASLATGSLSVCVRACDEVDL